jgi:predicted peptidase
MGERTIADNGLRADRATVAPASFDLVDRLLLIAIVCLAGYLSLEMFREARTWWQYYPRPGAQVYQQYVGKERGDANAAETVVDYLLYLPPDYGTTRRWPLVVFLHGAGECGQNLELVRQVGLAKRIEQGFRPGFVLVSPQCPASSAWDPKTITELMEHICTTMPIDRDRVYLTGFSMGGFGTWQTACYNPSLFAAIAPLAGGGDVNQAERLAKVPIWAFHGAEDKVVPLAASKDMVEAVRKCGGRVEFTVYPGCGHGICEATYQDRRVLEWLLAQRRGHPASTLTPDP